MSQIDVSIHAPEGANLEEVIPLPNNFYPPEEGGFKPAKTVDNVSVVKQANVYFDGRCVSHTVLFADGTRKSVGVIFPSSLTFNTGAPEIMEIVAGVCKVRQADASDWQTYGAGTSFNVPANSHFDIETVETLHYVCHFG